mmetsp:Transcript_29348/g.76929  ORF Transcript_29348/g.76929 Transcript_29348/m.76929 type:complete len:312 (-) Transcript_29348:207-1142(-)
MGGVRKFLDIHRILSVDHHGSFVAVDVKIVRRREDCDDRREGRLRVLRVHVIPLILCLVGANHRQQTILIQKFTRGLLCVDIRAPSSIVVDVLLRPIVLIIVLVRVGPQQVAQGSHFVRLAETVDCLHIVHRVDLWRQPAVNAKELLVHDGHQWQAIERVHAHIIHLLRILVLHFGLESEVLCEVPAFVVASQQVDGLRKVELECPEVEDAFEREVATVHVIAEEEIPCVLWIAAVLEQLDKVEELAVDVADDGDGGGHLEHVRFRPEHCLHLSEHPNAALVGQATLLLEVIEQQQVVGHACPPSVHILHL